MNGRILGLKQSPTTQSASGVWLVSEAAAYQSAGLWPAAASAAAWAGEVPQQVLGLTGWWDLSDSSTLYDATSGGSLVSADGVIARIEDKSGNGRHWAQSVSASRPTRKASIQNSLDIARFDGGDRMESAWNIESVWSSTAYTAFAVAKCTSAPSDDPIAPFNAAIVSQSTDSHGAFYFRSSNLVQALGADAVDTRIAEAAYTIGQWKVFTQRHDGSDLTIRVNGGSPGTDTMGTADLFSGETMRLGQGSEYFTGDLGELIFYNAALSTQNRETIESYLMAKWGV